MSLDKYLETMVKSNASDLYLSTGAPVSMRVYGEIEPVDNQPLAPGAVKELAYGIMSENQIKEFEKNPEINLALSTEVDGRFRVNVFKQRNEVAMVVRHFITQIPDMESLKLPKILTNLIMEKRGLLLVVGATGSGKSTTLASLVDYRNSNCHDHIITIEEPIEYIHSHKKSVVNQREIGMDTESYSEALKNTLRQAPDVIQIGEIRTRDAMEHALTFAETGHLCISTLHANNANQSVERILSFFPEEQSEQILYFLSMTLCGIVSQRLIPDVNGGRVAAIEVLCGTPLVRDLIKKGDIDGMKEIMEKSSHLGMQTFDQALLMLYKEGRITIENALANADSPNNLRLKIAAADGNTNLQNETLSITPDDDDKDDEIDHGQTFSFDLK